MFSLEKKKSVIKMLQKPFVSRKNQTLPVKVEACLSTPSQPRFIFLQQSKKKQLSKRKWSFQS